MNICNILRSRVWISDPFDMFKCTESIGSIVVAVSFETEGNDAMTQIPMPSLWITELKFSQIGALYQCFRHMDEAMKNTPISKKSLFLTSNIQHILLVLVQQEFRSNC